MLRHKSHPAELAAAGSEGCAAKPLAHTRSLAIATMRGTLTATSATLAIAAIVAAAAETVVPASSPYILYQGRTQVRLLWGRRLL